MYESKRHQRVQRLWSSDLKEAGRLVRATRSCAEEPIKSETVEADGGMGVRKKSVVEVYAKYSCQVTEV